MKHFQGLILLWFGITTISAATISPHGGYLSIEEGADFYAECIGTKPQWIIAQRLTSDTSSISLQTTEYNRKSILAIRGMDASLVGPYLCQANETISTIILQLTKRKPDMTKQIRFMSTTTNQIVAQGDHVRLNCFAQYYSEKAMDSPYLPKILWFFERRQIQNNTEKYTLGTDSLVIRNFSYYDQGVYYCRAFITLRNNFLSKLYPIYVQLQSKPPLTLTFHSKFNLFYFLKDSSSSFTDETSPSDLENKKCTGFHEHLVTRNSISYCNIDGYISNQTCSNDDIWNDEYSQCVPSSNPNQILHILPNLSHLNVEMGRTYTLLCQSHDEHIEPEWSFENGTTIQANASFDQPITTYTLSDTHALYLRLAPVTIGTYVCRSRSLSTPMNRTEVTVATTSITLTAQMIAETHGISLQSSTLPEYHVRPNTTLFIACRPEYFDFQMKITSPSVPIAQLIRVTDNHRFELSETTDGLLIDRIGKNESGMYLCQGRIPLPNQLISSIYPVMVFISDPLCENIFKCYFIF
ncbi:unnamed protein product [Adineta ricciae]|uniref:Soluble interferon alpha/beta receptor OPG204 n=1 Tax=Adineta ricciae TaxID=249248 RepID=A0A816D9S0_ADIRI|nr:unnamed protein product [Adineta ricciae]